MIPPMMMRSILSRRLARTIVASPVAAQAAPGTLLRRDWKAETSLPGDSVTACSWSGTE
jgi:hypothetical protein